jgi:hypothetical protein
MGILGTGVNEKTHLVYHTGKALRAFPHTQAAAERPANDDPAWNVPF